MMGIADLIAALGEDRLAATLVDAALKGALFLGLAVMLNLALRRASAAVRHLVWSLAFAAVLLTPLLTSVLPRWPVPSLPALVPTSPPTHEEGPPAGAIPGTDESPAPAYAPTPELEATPSPEPGREPVWERPRSNQTSFASNLPAGLERQALTREVAAGTPASSNPGAGGAQPTASRPGTERHAGRATWALFIWMAGMLSVVASIIVGFLRTAQIARRAQPLARGTLPLMLDELAARLGITRRVVLLRCEGSCVPMTWGVLRPRILLPRDAVEWSSLRLRAVLLHELAHVKRLDYLTQLVARLSCGLHWFNPLVWLAARRQRIERELACDDQVLRAGSRASDYAAHLVEIARSLRASRAATLLTVPMARSSQLGGRVQALLDGGRARSAVGKGSRLFAWIAAAVVVIPVAAAAPGPTESDGGVAGRLAESVDAPPGATLRDGDGPELAGKSFTVQAAAEAAMQGCDWNVKGGRGSSSVTVNDDEMRVKIRRGGCELKIELNGDITFDENFTQIASLSQGGDLEIEEKQRRATRRVTMKRERDGSLRRRWFVNGDERAWDREADAWVESMVLVLFRRSGYQATERAEAILARRGVDGLMQEISQLSSDYVARRYYTVLLSRADLDAATVQRIVRQVGEQIDSDHELAQLLIAIAQNQPLDESVRIAYVEATKSLQSDHEHRRVLSAILKRQDLSPEVARSMLRSAATIDSDHELATLLIELSKQNVLDASMADDFFKVVGTIDSDFEQRRVLSAAIDAGLTDPRFLDKALESAKGIGSDHELGQLLLEVARHYPADRQVPASYLAAARTIGSDVELQRVLASLVERKNLNSETRRAVLEAAQTIQSDHELSSLLKLLVNNSGLDEATRPAFFSAAARLGSDYSRRQVLAAALEAKPLTSETVEAVLETALEISSDHEMSSLLRDVAGRVTIDDRIRPAFMKAADTISSKYERDRVLAAAFESTR